MKEGFIMVLNSNIKDFKENLQPFGYLDSTFHQKCLRLWDCKHVLFFTLFDHFPTTCALRTP